MIHVLGGHRQYQVLSLWENIDQRIRDNRRLIIDHIASEMNVSGAEDNRKYFNLLEFKQPWMIRANTVAYLCSL
jgi:hypothetical protein